MMWVFFKARSLRYVYMLYFVCHRKVEEQDSDLTVQLYVFDSHKADDDEQLPGTKGVDLNSPLDVFTAVYKQVGQFGHLCS